MIVEVARAFRGVCVDGAREVLRAAEEAAGLILGYFCIGRGDRRCYHPKLLYADRRETMPKGQVKNRSSKQLWVVETDTGRAVAHRLASGRQSPAEVDADGFKAVDGTPIDNHQSWVKIIDLSTADVEDDGSQLTRGCILCSSVEEDEFGEVIYEESDDWGETLS